jgi:hypothetical protein
MSPHGFTYRDYEAILETARAHGYAFASFTDPPPSGRVVYLRHDIDHCIESAQLMAALEAEAGAVSTYLVMIRSENYNPFTPSNIARLRAIRALGHELGLHFTGAGGDDLPACIADDARLLETAVGAPVRVFSFHNPTESGEFTVEVPGLVNAYADRFFRDALYLSESNMHWPQGSPVEVLARGEHPVAQILVHPLSYRGDFASEHDVLLWFLRDKVRRLLAHGIAENRVLREQPVSLAEVAAFIAREEPER